jgi:hypothetical protein
MQPTVCIAMYQTLRNSFYIDLSLRNCKSIGLNMKKDLFQKDRIRLKQQTLNAMSLYGPVHVPAGTK